MCSHSKTGKPNNLQDLGIQKTKVRKLDSQNWPMTLSSTLHEGYEP